MKNLTRAVLGLVALVVLAGPGHAKCYSPVEGGSDGACGAVQQYLDGSGKAQSVDSAHPLPTNAAITIATGASEFSNPSTTITVAASSHANNTCLGAIQAVTVTQGIASGGATINAVALRSSSGLLGAVTAIFFEGSSPSAVCANDGDALAMSVADFGKQVPGGSVSAALTTLSGGLTQSAAVFQFIQGAQIRLDASKHFWVAFVNTSGVAMTPAANGLTHAEDGYASQQ